MTKLSDLEQEEIIKKLREQVVKINTEKSSTPQKVDEKEILEKMYYNLKDLV